MANIFINEYLRLNKSGLQVKDINNKWTDLHCQQGRLDGACVVYSVVMALLSIGYISNDDIDVSEDPTPDRRKGKGKLLSRLLDENGLVRDGYYLRTMAQLMSSLCEDLIVKTHKKEEILIPTITDCVESNIPVVLMVHNNNMKHAVFVVGFEYDNNDKTTKLLCLDPSDPNEDTAYWNCILDVSRKGVGEYPYCYITKDIKSKIELLEILTIEKDN